MNTKRVLALALLALLALAGGARAEEAAADDAAAEAEPAVPGFSGADAAAVKEGSEKYEFQSDVSRLMSLIVHSLYSDRDIFLREVISNAADALDKIRFASLTDKSVLGEGDEANLEIRVDYNKKDKTITIRDTGVGMTKEDLKNYLGVVASSGTTAFLDAASQGEDALKLIGQFGVGFYSVFLVADEVTVVSKHNDDDQHVWVSRADSEFTISRDPRGNTLGRGTEITLRIKEDAEEYLDQNKLEQILQRYSQFIAFPILLNKVSTVDKEVPADADDDEAAEEADLPPGVGDDFDTDKLEGLEADIAAKEKEAPEDEPVPEDDDELRVEDEDEDDEGKAKEEEKPKTKTIQVEEWKWEQMNAVKAVWTRRASEVTEEEYAEFYKALTKDYTGPLAHNHFSAEGEITFKSLLYVPERADAQLWDKYHEKSKGLKLYVRRVLIADEFSDLLPNYLKFIKGVVDSDDLPLNVSRETLSKSRVLRVMGKKLTRKALDMLRRMSEAAEEWLDEKEAEAKKEEAADDDEAAEEKKEEDADADSDDEDEKEDADAKAAREKEAGKYATFWKEFGKAVKLGVIEDSANKNKLTKLLRFPTSKSEDEPVSLQRYVDRMPEDQKFIYYITGENLDSVRDSPFLERLNERGFEVVFMVDALDEYVMSNMQDFDGKKFMSVSKEGFKLDEGEDAKNLEKRIKKRYSKFVDWLKEVFEGKVEKVVVSNRIAKSPCVLVTSQYGWSANMERIMKAQTFGDAERNKYMVAKKTLEINPRHPLIRELKARSEQDAEGESVRDLANLMFDAALLNSGFQMENAGDFAERIHRVMASNLDVAEDAKAATDEELFEGADEEEDDEEEDNAAADEDDAGELDDFDLGDFGADEEDAPPADADHDEL